MTLAWVAAIVLHVTLFSYAGKQAASIAQESRQIASIDTEDHIAWSQKVPTTDLSESFSRIVLSRLDGVDPSAWADGFVVLTLFLLGSAFWQATVRIRRENEILSLSDPSPTSSWRTDSLLLTYLTLLVLQIGLIAVISLTPVSVYTFWIGYAGVVLAQRTSVGQRIGEELLRTVESRFQPAHSAIR